MNQQRDDSVFELIFVAYNPLTIIFSFSKLIVMLNKKDLNSIQRLMKNEIRVELGKETKPIKKHLNKIDKNIESLLRLGRFSDLTIQNHDKRIQRVEKTLNLDPLSS